MVIYRMRSSCCIFTPDLQNRIAQICNISGVAGASIGVLHDSKQSTYNYGYRDVERRLKSSEKTMFGIGSITKPMIVAAMSIMVERQELTWDTKVIDILHDFRHQDRMIQNELTIADLLSHRAGLDGTNPLGLAFQGEGSMLLAKDDLLHIFEHTKVVAPIRTKWRYFVWGFSIAGLIIERKSGMKLATFLESQVFRPVGMANTTTQPSFDDEAEIAEPYSTLADGTAYHLETRQVYADTFFEASGGVFSNVHDMLIFAHAVLQSTSGEGVSALPAHNHVLSPHVPIEDPFPLERSCALAWIRTQLPNIVGLIGDTADLWPNDEAPELSIGNRSTLMLYHQGASVGYYSCLAMIPETKTAIVVLVNTMALSDAPDWISRAILETLFGTAQPSDYKDMARCSRRKLLDAYDVIAAEICNKRDPSRIRALEAYTGRYQNKTYGFTIDIKENDAAATHSGLLMTFQHKSELSYPLRHWHDDVFEWTLSFDEVVRRGRYHEYYAPFYQLPFNFDSRQMKASSFTWTMDAIMPDGELFERLS